MTIVTIADVLSLVATVSAAHLCDVADVSATVASHFILCSFGLIWAILYKMPLRTALEARAGLSGVDLLRRHFGLAFGNGFRSGSVVWLCCKCW